MHNCCVVGCKHNSNHVKANGQRYRFFRIPSDSSMRKQWMAKINRADFVPKKHSRVCDEHFVDKEPSVYHPVPCLNMGYPTSIVKTRWRIKPYATIKPGSTVPKTRRKKVESELLSGAAVFNTSNNTSKPFSEDSCRQQVQNIKWQDKLSTRQLPGSCLVRKMSYVSLLRPNLQMKIKSQNTQTDKNIEVKITDNTARNNEVKDISKSVRNFEKVTGKTDGSTEVKDTCKTDRNIMVKDTGKADRNIVVKDTGKSDRNIVMKNTGKADRSIELKDTGKTDRNSEVQDTGKTDRSIERKDTGKTDRNSKVQDTVVGERSKDDIIASLQLKVEILHEKIRRLTAANSTRYFGLHIIENNDKKTRFYTGFPTYSAFDGTYERMLKKKMECISLNSKPRKHDWTKRCYKKPGPKRSLPLKEEFLLVMMKLNQGYVDEDLGDRFGIHQTSVCRIVHQWIPKLASSLKKDNIVLGVKALESVHVFMGKNISMHKKKRKNESNCEGL
ncbi:uncharacterized protein LOC135473107 [Liolophura sinensis]|uniref:uncharacterized protein LOC135473107 n=1 Tax=Liolophura sinensis TaxID=3198878 RepID=UPI0031580488